MSISIQPAKESAHSGGIWCAAQMPFYDFFQTLLKEIDLPEKGNFIVTDEAKLQRLGLGIAAELLTLMKQKATSSKRKHNFIFEGEFYNLDMKSSISDRMINTLLIAQHLLKEALETKNGIMITIA